MKYIDLLPFIIVCYGHSCSGAEEIFLSHGEGTGVLFEINRANKTWSEAQKRCMEKNGTLVEINNKTTQVKLQNSIINITDVHGNYFWIGLKKKDVWNWTTGGCSMSYTAWAQGSPSDGNRTNNHAILWYDGTNSHYSSENFKWKDVSGQLNKINGKPTKYICQSEMPCAQLSKCACEKPSKCKRIHGKCFYFGGNDLPDSENGVSWAQAKERCDAIEDVGLLCSNPGVKHLWSLACIDDMIIQRDLEEFLLRNTHYRANYWISAEKSDRREWKWDIDKHMGWAYWNPGQPSTDSSRSCVAMRNLEPYKFHWFKMRCDDENSFICQYLNGSWSTWVTWSDCSRTCGRGVRKRYRQCSDPAPSGGGKLCPGNNSKSETCIIMNCPVNGNWSPWTDWSSCSLSCGIGVRERTRQCNRPIPRNDGIYCQGKNTSQAKCGGTTCADERPLHIGASSKNTTSINLMNANTHSMTSQVLSPTAQENSMTYYHTQTQSTTGIFSYENRQTSETFTTVTYERLQSDDASKALVTRLPSGVNTLYEIMTNTTSSLFATRVYEQNNLDQQTSASHNAHDIVFVDRSDSHTTVLGSLLSKNYFVSSTNSVYSHLSWGLEVTATSEVEEKTSILTETGNQLLPSDNTIELTGTISNHGIEFHENDSDTNIIPSLNFYTWFSSEQSLINSLLGSTGVPISSSASELIDSMYSTRDQGGGHISSVASLGDGPSSIYSPTPATMHIDMREYSLSTISKDQLSTSSAIYISNTICLLHESALDTMVPSTINPLTSSYGEVTPTALPGDSDLSSLALVPSLHTTSHRFDQNSNHGIKTTQYMTKSSLDYLDLQPSMQTQTSSGNVVALDNSFTTVHHFEYLTYASSIDTTSEDIDTNTILQGSISGVYKTLVLDVITFESLFEQESESNHRVKQTDLLTSNNSEVTGNIITNGAELSSEQITPTKVTSHKSHKTERRISSTTSWSVMSNTILQPSKAGEIVELTKETESLGMQTGVLDSRSEANMTLSYQGVDIASLTTQMTTVSSSLLQAETGNTSISIQQSRNEAKETSSIISPTKVWDESIHLGTDPFSSNSALATFEKASAVSDMNTDTSSGTLTSYSSISIQQNTNETKVTSSVISPTKVWDESIHLGTDPFSSNSALGTFDTTTTKASAVSEVNADTSPGILTTTQSTEKSSKYPVYQWALIGLSGILVPVLIVVGTFVYCCKRYCRNRSKEEVADTGVTHASQVWYENVMYESNTERVHPPGHRISRLEIIHNQRIQSMVLRKDRPLHKEDENPSQQQVSHSPQRSDPQKNLKQKSLSVIMDRHYKSDRENSESRISSPLSRKRYSEISYPMSFHESKSAAPPRRPQTMIQSPYKYSRTRRVETLYIEEEGGILLPYGDVEGCDPIPDYDDIRVIPRPDY